jgi:putative PIN family toxin of toxin-antitoxin system
VFDDPGIAPLRAAVEAGRDEVLIDAACESELERVLGYAFYREILPPQKQRACLDEARRVVRRISSDSADKTPLPRCRDPDDQKFLELALAGRADCLVTKDLELLRLARRRLPFRIIRPCEKF